MEFGRIYKKSNPTSYCLGGSLTYECLKEKPEAMRHVFFHPDFMKSEKKEEFVSLCEENGIPWSENERVFRRLADKEKCTVIGEFAKYEDPVKPEESHLVLHQPANMGNLGTIIRAMSAFSWMDLVIITPACDLYDPKVIRASMGAFFHIRFSLYPDFASYRKEHGNKPLFCFRLNAARNLPDVSLPKGCALVFGNESRGLPAEFDHLGEGVLIPISKDVDSLSLPMAVSIALYEYRKGVSV